MLNLPESIKALFKRDSVRKNFRAHFPNGEFSDITNDDVVAESVKFTESLCSQNTFKFGLAEASVLEFETVGVGNMYGMTIEAGIEIDTSSLSAADISAIQDGTWDGTLVLAENSDIGYGVFRVPLGVFRVESCPRNHGAMTHRQVTAYTRTTLQEKMNFPQRAPWDKVYVDLAAISAATTGAGLVYSGETTADLSGANDALLFDSSKKAYSLDISYIVACASVVQSSQQHPAFFKTDIKSIDMDAYESIGISIAQSITDAGLNLYYSSAGKKIYKNNEDALRNMYPELFAPVVKYSFNQTASPHLQFGIFYQVINSDSFIPIFSAFGSTFSFPFDVYYFPYDGPYTNVLRQIRILSRVTAIPKVFVRKVTSSGSTVVAEIPLQVPWSIRPKIKYYSVSDLSGIKVTVNAIDKSAKRYFVDITNTPPSSTKAILSHLSYGELDLIEAGEDALEVMAKFAKQGRDGNMYEIHLDNSNPIEILPGDYTDCWWDEYDISPIGNVIIKSEQEESSYDVQTVSIGDGFSTYDMSNNIIVNNLVEDESVETFVNQAFAPNASSVEFTPTELTMQGWPWIEAGDALEITAEDGTVINTYALRLEMHGIQNLQADIVSKGGEIMGEA